jgi:endonuclease/exonuclease/phosphatase family metal-dependent hydrolase
MTRRFTVISYNIHGCVGRDRTRDADRVARAIRSFGADIIGLQEVDTHSGPGLDSTQMDYLPHATGLNAARGPIMTRHHGHYGNLILTPLPILAVRHIDLSVGRHEPRGALDVDIALHDIILRVVVTHFGLLPWERRTQAQRLMAALKHHPGDPLVVMGHLNEWLPRSRSLQA